MTSLLAGPGERAMPTGEREVQELKAGFLRCERAAATELLGLGDAASCSAVYERLLARGFGGDFRLLLAWWRTEHAAAARGAEPPTR